MKQEPGEREAHTNRQSAEAKKGNHLIAYSLTPTRSLMCWCCNLGQSQALSQFASMGQRGLRATSV